MQEASMAVQRTQIFFPSVFVHHDSLLARKLKTVCQSARCHYLAVSPSDFFIRSQYHIVMLLLHQQSQASSATWHHSGLAPAAGPITTSLGLVLTYPDPPAIPSIFWCCLAANLTFIQRRVHRGLSFEAFFCSPGSTRLNSQGS